MTLLAVEHPDWMLDAECTRERPELFYPEPAGRLVTEAKKVCARCTVAAECLAYALEHGEINYGVWGGKSVTERRELAPSRGRGRRRIPLAIKHGTEHGYQTHRRRGEQACGACLEACAAAHRRRIEQKRANPSPTPPATAPISPGGPVTTTDHSTTEWRKAAASAGKGACVEVRFVMAWGIPRSNVEVRDSKDPDGPALRYTTVEWAAFLAGVKGGEFDA